MDRLGSKRHRCHNTLNRLEFVLDRRTHRFASQYALRGVLVRRESDWFEPKPHLRQTLVEANPHHTHVPPPNSKTRDAHRNCNRPRHFRPAPETTVASRQTDGPPPCPVRMRHSHQDCQCQAPATAGQRTQHPARWPHPKRSVDLPRPGQTRTSWRYARLRLPQQQAHGDHRATTAAADRLGGLDHQIDRRALASAEGTIEQRAWG